jgi:hypothetical protein
MEHLQIMLCLPTFRKVEHPSYNAGTLVNDFTLLRLSAPVDFTDVTLNDVSPACWPTRDEVPGAKVQ